ncbi:MAG TPA: 1-deoxy-D-xylulose-5-phosphate synthase [Acidimicrobiales bacterium]|nr:1-deoxy-D-xylulose-5-phosphate synthase [Acidimicrobiales bacterium]
MLLETIHQPGDLRALSALELEELAGEIRDFIVASVADNSGHLGSNLGAVELTLALHRVFDSPRDAILWDTGHQAYVHKIVTGRSAGFAQLRRAGGLSGYPSREESEHDFVENSHASTILSYAYGLAVARDGGADPGRRHIVAVIGDGSMTGGMAYEALNNLGHSDRNVIIVLNDNGRSYAPTVSKLSNSLTSIRLNPVYMRRQRRMELFLRDLPLVGTQAEKGMEAVKAAVREYFQPPAFFESLGVRYVGPIDGHDIAALEVVMRNATEFDGPIVIHALTQKGRGYPPAEDDDEKHLHDAPVFDRAVGPPKAVPTGYTQAFAEAVIKEAEHDPRLVAITAAMPGPTGLLPFQDRFPDRCFDVGIAEQHAVTAAAGMAMGGLRPIVAVYSTFLNRAWDQVVYDVALHRLPVLFALDRAGITGDDGASHHGVYDLALLSRVPGMTVLAPSSAQELQQMLHDGLGLLEQGPVAIRYPKGQARQVPDDQVGTGLDARLVTAGDGQVCLLAVGKLVANADKAAQQLAAEGIHATVWDVRCCAPLDESMIVDAARHQIVITCEDGIRDGGIGMTMADRVHHACGTNPLPHVEVLGVPTRFIPTAKPDRILSQLGLDAEGIAGTVRRLLGL